MRSNQKRIILRATLSALFVLIFGGTVLFHTLEEWTWIESFYFTIVTITTVGYGDLSPSSDISRLFTAMFIVIGVSIGAGILSYYGSSAVRNRVNKRIKEDKD